MKNLFLPLLTVLVTILFASSAAQASLLISPLRVVFDDRDRSAAVTVINTGKATTTYRIELVDNLQVADGSYQRIAADENTPAELFSAKEMLRYSPRQVTLKPDERQQVRISLRKPAGLANGEYRSHLAFTQLPDPTMLETNPKGAKMQVFMLTGFTIPVQVRQGTPNVTAKLSDAKLVKADHGWDMQVTVDRTGDFSSFGKIQVFWRANENSSEQLLNFIDNASVYRELKQRTFHIHLKPEQVQPGLFRIVYAADKLLSNTVLDSIELPYSHP
jgi:P pilus assembly chaperone PapD